MRCTLISALLLLLLASVQIAAEPDGARVFADDKVIAGHHPDWVKQSFLDLDADLADALEAGKKGLMIFSSP